MSRRGYHLDGRRTLTHRSLVRYLRLALRRGDETEATRYAFELAGYLGRLGRHHALDALETFRAAVRTLAITALVFTLTTPAWAASAQDQAAAEVLFQEAKKLVEAKNFAEACPKFVESQRLDPGPGTALNIASCYEASGKLASAWGAFKEAEMLAKNMGDTARQGEAVRRAGLLEPRLSKLTIVVPGTTRAVPGLVVKKDGAVVGEGQWGSALPADVGNYTIEASAPGCKPWSSIVRIGTDGSSASLWVPPPEKQTDAPAPPYWNGRRVAGVAFGSVGVAGVIVGGALGGLALAKNSASKQDCSPTNPNSCTPAGVALRSTAFAVGNASTTAIVIGGAFLTTGVVLFAIAEPSKKKTEGSRVEVLSGIGALALRGRF